MNGYALFAIASIYYINETVAEDRRVEGQSWFTMATTLGSVLSGLFGGNLLDLAGVPALLGMASANLTAELDNAILDQNADHDMNALRERLRRSKMTMELYCKAGQTTPDEVRAAFRRDAERKMRSILAVQAIAKAEQITVSNAEVDAEYVRLSKLHDTPEAEIRNVLSRDAVASAVTTQKVQRFLIDHANITSVVEKE